MTAALIVAYLIAVELIDALATNGLGRRRHRSQDRHDEVPDWVKHADVPPDGIEREPRNERHRQ